MAHDSWLLALETATDHGGLALLRDGTVVVERAFGTGMVHGREIAPAVIAACAEAGIRVPDIRAVAVDIGPGSYTGIRVGMAAAKGLCRALGIPIRGVVSLDAMAHQERDARPLCAVLDAKWHHVYAAMYDAAGRTGGPWALPPEEIPPRLAPGTIVAGDGAARFADVFRGFPLRPQVVPRASSIGMIGAARLEREGPDDLRTLLPLYLRRTEAEIRRGI